MAGSGRTRGREGKNSGIPVFFSHAEAAKIVSDRLQDSTGQETKLKNSNHKKQARRSLGSADQTVPTEDICKEMDICRAAFVGRRSDRFAVNETQPMSLRTLTVETVELQRRLAKLYPELMRIQQFGG